MKTRRYIAAAFAALSAIAFASCTKDILDVEPSASEKTFELKVEGTFAASEDPATRTMYNEKTIWWKKSDTVVFYQRYYSSETATTLSTHTKLLALSKDRADFSATLTFNTPGKFPVEYVSVYPNGARNGKVLTNPNGYYCPGLTLSSTQKPTADCYDPACDLLISDYIVSDTQLSSLRMKYNRVVALGKMALTGIPSDSPVTTVTISATDDGSAKHIAGTAYYDADTFAVRKEASYATAIALDCSEFNAAGSLTAHFCCYPFELAEGDSFRVAVKTVAGETFVKEFFLKSGQELKFQKDRATQFTVDMSSSWFSIGNSSTKPTGSTINFKCNGIDIASGKYCAVPSSEFASISNLSDYVEERGTEIAESTIQKINEGSTMSIKISKLIPDTDYTIIVKATNSAGQSQVLTLVNKTDWFSMIAFTNESYPGRIYYTYYGAGIASLERAIVKASLISSVKTADYESVLDSSTSYEATLYTLNESQLASLNESGASGYTLGTGQTSTDHTFEAETDYVVMVRVTRTNGDKKFVYATVKTLAAATE